MEVRAWLGGPPRGPAVVGKPSRRTGSGREALPVVRESFGGPRRDPGVVWRPPKGQGVIGRPSQRS